MKIIFVIAVILIFKEAAGNPTGTPTEACQSMDPSRGHGTLGQTTASPVKFVLSKTKMAPTGETINVRIESIDPLYTFKGHMIQARDEANNDTIVGSFSSVTEDSKVIDCSGENSQNSGSHVNVRPKTSASLNWQPDGFTGKVRFFLTLVQDMRTFWIKIPSEVVEIGL